MQTAVAKKDAAKAFAYGKTPDKFKHPTDLQVRFRTGAVYVVLSVTLALVSNLTCVIMLCVLAGICAGELFFMLRSDAKLPNELLGTLAAVAYPVSMWKLGLSGSLLVTRAACGAACVVRLLHARTRGRRGRIVFRRGIHGPAAFEPYFGTHVAAWHLGWRARVRHFL